MAYNLGGGMFAQILSTVNAAEARRKANDAAATDMIQKGFMRQDHGVSPTKREGISGHMENMLGGGHEFNPSEWVPGGHHPQVAADARSANQIDARKEAARQLARTQAELEDFRYGSGARPSALTGRSGVDPMYTGDTTTGVEGVGVNTIDGGGGRYRHRSTGTRTPDYEPPETDPSRISQSIKNVLMLDGSEDITEYNEKRMDEASDLGDWWQQPLPDSWVVGKGFFGSEVARKDYLNKRLNPQDIIDASTATISKESDRAGPTPYETDLANAEQVVQSYLNPEWSGGNVEQLEAIDESISEITGNTELDLKGDPKPSAKSSANALFGGFGRGAGTRFGTDALTPSGPDDGSGWLSGFVDDLRSGRGGKKFEWGPEEEEFLGSEWVQKYGPHENIPVGELFPEGTPRMGRERPKDIIDDNQPMFTEADAEVRQDADIPITPPYESAQPGETYDTPRGGGMILDQDQTLNADANLEANRKIIAEHEAEQVLNQWAEDGYDGAANTEITPEVEGIWKDIVDQETGGEAAKGRDPYKAVSPAGALGKAQIMPGNIPDWSMRTLGREITSKQFINNPDLQDMISKNMMQEMFDKAMKFTGGDAKESARRVSAEWYGGPSALNKMDSTVEQAGGFPSRKKYIDQVADKSTARQLGIS